MVDFHRSGGVMALLNELRDDLTLNRPTVAGVEIGNLLHPGVNRNEDIIRPKNNPVYPTGGIVIMKGNLAPKGALVRHTIAGPKSGEFTGPAVCYDQQTNAIMDILAGKVSSGDVLVIRYQGPRGGPGFSENFKVVLILDALGLNDVAVITDSRFSGATEGALYAGYISPEAFVGGPLAAVHNGDCITISIKNRRIDVHLSDEEIKKRLEGFEPPAPRIKSGILVDWRLTATQFHEGAMLKRKL
jgi:dihydroxy-acid dehydratase